jgi:hypothetical protein
MVSLSNHNTISVHEDRPPHLESSLQGERKAKMKNFPWQGEKIIEVFFSCCEKDFRIPLSLEGEGLGEGESCIQSFTR